MKNLLTLLFVFGISTSNFSQTAGNYVYEKMKNTPSSFGGPGDKNIRSFNSNTLTIEASALMNIIPDAQIVVFTLVQLGESAQEATELIDSKLNPIKAGLNQIGISNSNIVVDMISFIPRYEDTVINKKFSKTFTEIPKGFELKKNIHIKFKDHELIDKIIAICASYEVYDMAKVEYVILDNEENMLAMRDKMLKHLGDKIAFYHDLEIQDEIGADWLIYQGLEELIAAVAHEPMGVMNFDTSCFSGFYVAGKIDEDYLKNLEVARSDQARTLRDSQELQKELQIVASN